ncbi:MAG: molybdopterin-dependent oxidoreductase [Syntrophaceae bacterium]
MAKFTRRDFIKISGGAALGVAGAGMLSHWAWPQSGVIPDPGTTPDRIVPSYCGLCFWNCGILVHVKDDRIIKLTGNPHHPLSNGKLCPRGTGGTGLVYDPDRLKKPMIRKEERSRQVFREVEWDEALDYTAEKMLAIKKKYGPEAFALLTHGSGGAWLRQLITSYGTANIGVPSYALCKGPVETGFFLTYGANPPEVENTDMRNARCITLIGTHLGENMHNTQVQDFSQAIGNGAALIVVDPRYSVAASKARYWLPIKPGTDTALLLAWMNVIIEEQLYDADYVGKYTTGFDELKKHVADKNPEWAYTRTSIKPELIRETARLMAAFEPSSFIHCGRRTTWYGDDTQRLRAIAMLNALLGAWGRKGGYYLPAQMDLPGYPYLKKSDYKPKPPVDQPKNTAYPFAEAILATGLRDASIPGSAAYDIHGWMVYGTNPLSSFTQPQKTYAALQHLDFIVSVANLPIEIAGWSDVVLPECTYLERYDDLNSPPFRVPFAALRQPAIAPMYDSKPAWWIAKQLSTRLGLEEYFPWQDAEDYLRVRVKNAALDWDSLKKNGVIVGETQPIYIEDGIVPTFDTPSKKIELYSAQLKAAGFDPMPEFKPVEEPPEGMFRLLSGRAPVHSFGMTTNNRLLGDCYAENEVWLNDKVCEELGIKDKQQVVLVNTEGARSHPVKVKKTRRIRPDCVFLVHGFGSRQRKMEFAFNKGASDTVQMNKDTTDPLIGSKALNVNFVKIEQEV